MCQVPRFILPPALYLICDPLRFFRALPVLFRGASSFTTFSHEVFFLLQNNANPMPNPIFCQHAPSCHYYSHKTTAISDKTAQTLPYFHIPPSVPQTSQRNHLHPILPGISHLPSRQHNQKARQSQHLPPLLLIPLPYQIPQGQQMPGSFLDIPASQLTLDKGIPPVRQMQHRVGLQAIPVVVIRQRSTQCLRINLQIPNAHTLIHKSERLQIQLKVPRRSPQGGHGD